MPQVISRRRGFTAAAAVGAILAGLMLVACGGSSSSSLARGRKRGHGERGWIRAGIRRRSACLPAEAWRSVARQHLRRSISGWRGNTTAKGLYPSAVPGGAGEVCRRREWWGERSRDRPSHPKGVCRRIETKDRCWWLCTSSRERPGVAAYVSAAESRQAAQHPRQGASGRRRRLATAEGCHASAASGGAEEVCRRRQARCREGQLCRQERRRGRRYSPTGVCQVRVVHARTRRRYAGCEHVGQGPPGDEHWQSDVQDGLCRLPARPPRLAACQGWCRRTTTTPSAGASAP